MKSFLKSLVIVYLCLHGLAVQAQGGSVALMEIMFLNSGQSHEQAEAWMLKMAEVTKRYGARPVAGLRLKKWLKGGSQGIYNADFVVATEFPSQRAMNRMLKNDKDYDSLLFERDELFDQSKSIIFLVESMDR